MQRIVQLLAGLVALASGYLWIAKDAGANPADPLLFESLAIFGILCFLAAVLLALFGAVLYGGSNSGDNNKGP